MKNIKFEFYSQLFFMKISFSKYHGAGNDFIILDNRLSTFDRLSTIQIQFLCDRHFGIGADGLMTIQNDPGYDFRMVYYNSNGKEGSMCGNGGRCITRFAQKLGIIEKTARFITIDGEHEASIAGNNIKLRMTDVSLIENTTDYFHLNTGSPHYVTFVKDVMSMDVITEGRKIRYNDRFKEKGINVNFVEITENNIVVRTYERGVEDETLSCGTGVVASAVVSAYNKPDGNYNANIKTKGGNLSVSFRKINNENYQQILLTGPAEFVFDGEIILH